MAENYKHLYEQMKTMVEMYQDELVPGMRKKIEELEQSQIKVRCKDCKHWRRHTEINRDKGSCWRNGHHFLTTTGENHFCAYGEKRNDETSS